MSTIMVGFPPELRQLLTTIARRLGQSEEDVIMCALYQYVRVHDGTWPKSIGAGWDAEVTGENSEDWLRDNWRPD